MKQKNIRIILFLISIFTIFSSILYTSCQPDPCLGINCQNGGACSKGACICPTGYTGTFCATPPSVISFINKTLTPIHIVMNGNTQTIPTSDGMVSFIGTPGTYFSATATTSGATTSGSTVGKVLYWDSLDYTFPMVDTLKINLNVGTNFFFLKIQNHYSYSINAIYVNYGNTDETCDSVICNYNNTTTYIIGYYPVNNPCQLYLTSTDGYYWEKDLYPYIVNEYNQWVTYTVN